jgi:hypothetical protein
MNVHWQMGVSLGAALKKRRTRECPWAKGVATMGSIQREDMNVHWQVSLEATILEEGRTRECPAWVAGLSLGAMFERGEDT